MLCTRAKRKKGKTRQCSTQASVFTANGKDHKIVQKFQKKIKHYQRDNIQNQNTQYAKIQMEIESSDS